MTLWVLLTFSVSNLNPLARHCGLLSEYNGPLTFNSFVNAFGVSSEKGSFLFYGNEK